MASGATRRRRMNRSTIRKIVSEFPVGYEFTAADVRKILEEMNLHLEGKFVGKYLTALEPRYVIRARMIHNSVTDCHVWRRV